MCKKRPFRILIVDDEPLAREKLRHFLNGHPELEIIRECSSGVEAIQAILDSQPDLIFLDVQLPGLTGYEVLNAIPSQMKPVVILITAHAEQIRQNSNYPVVSVLLKPFDKEHFETILSEANRALGC
jgi:two-component system LytT family response regulator